jgi:hypothetical protein
MKQPTFISHGPNIVELCHGAVRTHIGLFARVRDNGRAEAALIALAGLLRKG